MVAEFEVTALCIDLDLTDGTGREGGLEFLNRVRAKTKHGPPALIWTETAEDELSIRLDEIVEAHDSLNDLHFELMRLYLFLGVKRLPRASV